MPCTILQTKLNVKKYSLELDEVFKVAEEASANLVTIGVSLDHCHVPGRDATEDRIVAGEMEYGMGMFSFHRWYTIVSLTE